MTAGSSANFVGKLVLTIELNETCTITSVSIDNSRPTKIGQLLCGKTPEQAIQLIPKVFLLCSQAQQAAATGAIFKAQSRELSPEMSDSLAERCALEWLKEHCWQTWQMQRELFGSEYAMKESISLNRLLLQSLQALPPVTLDDQGSSKVSADKWIQIEAQLESLFGIRPSKFRSLKWSEFIDWTQTDAPYAHHFSVNLHNAASLGSDDNWSEDLESGSLVRQKNHPLIQQALDCWGSGIVTRMLARFIEISRITENPELARMPEPGMAHASRGVLAHTVKLSSDGVIQSYEINAPTDRYFDKGGVVEQALMNQQLETSDPSWVRQLIWAIDPCVEFQIEVKE
ncbi:hypothetical protein [Vibrio sp. HN007]|uniref:hypothetical protein n=1 Tax=Vibrio iocasae TaxID=3098914 RepID=UPI0035D3E3D3